MVGGTPKRRGRARTTGAAFALVVAVLLACATSASARSFRFGDGVGLSRPSASSAAAVAPGPDPTEGQLSDEGTFTRWAHPRRVAPVVSDPTSTARRVGRLHLRTEDGFAEVYVLLNAHVDAQGQRWVQIRVPQRPNGLIGWVRRESLARFQVVTSSLVIDRHALRAVLYSRGAPVWKAPIGVGKRSTPTPAGRFWVREVFRVAGTKTYGPDAIGTSAYSVLSEWPGGGVVGIHGTDQPRLIPGRPSHGCVRMRNRDVHWLADHLPVGTPVVIV